MILLIEKSFDTGEVVLNYAEGPDNGPPIVFIPGSFGRWQTYSSIYPSFLDSYHIYSVDSRGRGKSGRTPGKYRIKDTGNDMTRFLTQVVKEPAVVTGHSEGGWIALITSHLVPDNILGIVILDSPIDLDKFIEEARKEKVRDYYRENQELVSKNVDCIIDFIQKQNPTRDRESVKHSAQSWSMVDPDWLELWSQGRLDLYFEGLDVYGFLKSASFPVLFIQADPEAGGMVPDGEIKLALEANPNVKHVFLDGVNHNLGINPFEETQIIEPIKDFLESLR